MKTYIKIFLIMLSIASVSCHKDYSMPGVSTLNVTGITATSAVCGGELEYFDPDIDAVGVSWSLENDTKTMDVNIKKDETRFYYEITGLTPNTKYIVNTYVRAKPRKGNRGFQEAKRGGMKEFTTLAK